MNWNQTEVEKYAGGKDKPVLRGELPQLQPPLVPVQNSPMNGLPPSLPQPQPTPTPAPAPLPTPAPMVPKGGVSQSFDPNAPIPASLQVPGFDAPPVPTKGSQTQGPPINYPTPIIP